VWAKFGAVGEEKKKKKASRGRARGGRKIFYAVTDDDHGYRSTDVVRAAEKSAKII